jgi:NADH-quinone oxidoreductase subunit M
MTPMQLPWLEAAVATPLIGAAWVGRMRDSARAQRATAAFAAAALIFSLGAWASFESAGGAPGSESGWIAGGFAIDAFSAPLPTLAALLHLMTAVATLGAKVRRYSFAGALASEAVLLATLSCKTPWGVVALLAAGAALPLFELHARGRSTRVFAVHMGLFVALLAGGQAWIDAGGGLPGVAMLTAAVLVRCGVAPLHCWATDLFENASLGTAMLFTTPMVGAYAAVRLVLPEAPDGMLLVLATASLATSLYAAAMAVVQREARRFFSYLVLSHTSLVLVGLETATNVSLAGALCVWIASSLALTGFGLTLRSLEARVGRLSLSTFHGLYEQTPILAGFFLLTGLASIGFPGTIGFVATELLVDGTVHAHPHVGAAVVLASALNGIAVLQAYFRLFTGRRHASSIALQARPVERFAVLTLSALILVGGLIPQPGVRSRYRAATEIAGSRKAPTPRTPGVARAADAPQVAQGMELSNGR